MPVAWAAPTVALAANPQSAQNAAIINTRNSGISGGFVNHQALSSFIWSVADLLRGDYAFLTAETSKIDNLTAEAESAITLLQERRSALISAAVTGKIAVRGRASR